MEVAEGEEEVTCAICFEAFATPTQLPCDCKVDYCPKCWDRCLAQSFKAAGQPRCPTCRGLVHVDYDAKAACLVFCRETGEGEDVSRFLEWREERENAAEEEGELEAFTDWWNGTIERLAQQALPRQVKLLKTFGAANAELVEAATCLEEQAPAVFASPSPSELRRHIARLKGSADGCVEKGELVQRLREVSGGSWGSLAAYWGSSAAAIASSAEGCEDSGTAGRRGAAVPQRVAPKCVCGGQLVRFLGEERGMIYAMHVTGQPEDSPMTQLLHRQIMEEGDCSCICDICDDKITQATWSCESGDDTILHATSYDVCDTCFVKYAFLGAEAPAQATSSTEVEAELAP